MKKYVSCYIKIKHASYTVVYVTLPIMLFTAQLPFLLFQRTQDISPNIKVFQWTRLLNNLDNEVKQVKLFFLIL